MMRKTVLLLACVVFLASSAAPLRADIVLAWNETLNDVIQINGTRPNHRADPGWSTRAIAMMNTAIYDAFQAVDRQYKPFLFTGHAAPNTDLYAAVNEAAFGVLQQCYPGELAELQAAYSQRMSMVPEGAAKNNGIALGQLIAQGCVDHRLNDGSNPASWEPYEVLDGAGKWRPQHGQEAWGPGWGTVHPFGVPSSSMINDFVNDLPPIPALTDDAYTAAFNQVKDYGGFLSDQRTIEMQETGLFWAYDRPGMGPPPVLFLRNVKEIAAQIGTPEDVNARLFAMVSVAQADAAIAAWDAKFKDNFWRPVGAIQGDRLDGTKGHDDGNPLTVEDAAWIPLGAPGFDPTDRFDDFTPPFPAWTSGHATMGGAVFGTLARFFGNDFAAADALYGDDEVTAQFTLYSAEFDAAGYEGMLRTYSAFTQPFDEWGLGKEGLENTPESENAMSRIYLGIHWIFDQVDGTMLGNRIADYVHDTMFQVVPEPQGALLAAVAAAAAVRRGGRRRRD
ncbi:MAG TPA: vanadium-dependent haloperoxidase [Lacipirellulaceae bacterium]|nr:vanadium-dependent haloperoxidase [Lacipirellulaceae bacterium]